MVDSQQGLGTLGANSTARATGLIVVGAIAGLFLLRKFGVNLSGSVSAG